MKWTVDQLQWDSGSLATFDEAGYLLLGQLLSAEGLSAAQHELTRMLAELHPALRSDEIYSAHQSEPWLLELVSSTAILDVVEQVIGENIVIWSTHLICKPPGTGRAIPWHQDGTYWNLAGRMTSLWLAFDDVDDENGTMSVLPGYHRGILPRRGTGDDFFDEEIDPAALPQDVAARAVAYRFSAGEGAMHDVLIPHRSPPNRSPDRWRRVLVVRYMSADGDLGQKQYPHYRTNLPFDRQFILLRGRDIRNRGLIPAGDFLAKMRSG